MGTPILGMMPDSWLWLLLIDVGAIPVEQAGTL
jgi:hypothetical protein